MIKNDILWVGVGEAGGKIVKEFLDTDSKYIGLFINTSSNDIDKLGDVLNVYKIPNARGTGRDRNKSKLYAKRHYESIIESILSFTSQRVINLVFSTAGGSGSGLAPTIARMLCKVIKETGIDKVVNLVAVLPSLNESKKSLSNTIECWNEVMSISKIVNNIMFIDNNNACGKDLNEINNEFVYLYDSVMEIPNEMSNEYSQIDETDLENVLLAKGVSCIFNIEDGDNTENNLKIALKESIFAKIDSFRSTHLCMAFNDADYDTIIDEFRPREEFFKGYNSENNLILVSGLRPPKEVIELIQVDWQYKQSNSEIEEDDVEDYIVKDNTVKLVEEKKPMKKQKADRKTTRKKINKLFDEDFWENEVF